MSVVMKSLATGYAAIGFMTMGVSVVAQLNSEQFPYRILFRSSMYADDVPYLGTVVTINAFIAGVIWPVNIPIIIMIANSS